MRSILDKERENFEVLLPGCKRVLYLFQLNRFVFYFIMALSISSLSWEAMAMTLGQLRPSFFP
jgi:hypothetical protein